MSSVRTFHGRSRTAAAVASGVGLLLTAGCVGGGSTPPGSEPSTLFPSRNPTIHTTVGPSEIRTRHVPGIGTILTDNRGKTLYVNNGDPTRAYSKPKCVGQCTNVWQPVVMAPQAFHPVVDGMAPKVGLLPGENGIHQLAVDNRRVYTYVEEQPGQITGNGFVSATPDGAVFRWSVITVRPGAPSRLPLQSASPTGPPRSTPVRTPARTPAHTPAHPATPKPVPTTPTGRAPHGGGR